MKLVETLIFEDGTEYRPVCISDNRIFCQKFIKQGNAKIIDRNEPTDLNTWNWLYNTAETRIIDTKIIIVADMLRNSPNLSLGDVAKSQGYQYPSSFLTNKYKWSWLLTLARYYNKHRKDALPQKVIKQIEYKHKNYKDCSNKGKTYYTAEEIIKIIASLLLKDNKLSCAKASKYLKYKTTGWVVSKRFGSWNRIKKTASEYNNKRIKYIEL